MSNPEDLRLARRVVAADRAAFDQLYEFFLPRVLAYAARRLGSEDDACAAAEASFERLLSSLHRYDGAVPLAVFVLAIVQRQVERMLSERSRTIRPTRVTIQGAPRVAL